MENESGSLDQSTESVSPAQSAPVQQPAVDQQEAFNKAVPAIKQKSYDKGYQDAESQLKQSGDWISKQEVHKMLDEREAKAVAAQEEARQNTYNAQWKADYDAKLADAKTRYEDYDNVVDERFVKTAPQVVVLAQMFPNAGDMLYELAKPENRSELSNLLTLAKAEDISYAHERLSELSESIKNNQQSASLKSKLPPKPFARVTPSELNLNSGKSEDPHAKFRNIRF
jgi:hypothetical protein